jgi:septum formation topological specificity factor MinE
MKNLSENLIDILFKKMNEEDDAATENLKIVLAPELIIRRSSLKNS